MAGNLRVLEPEELQLVAGGSIDPWQYPQYSYDTIIIVTGSTYQSPWVTTMDYGTYMQYYYQDPYANIASYYQYGSWYTAGGSSTATAAEVVDQQSDVEADSAQTTINSKPDSYQSEYMGLLYKDANGNVQVQDPVKLQKVGISSWETAPVYQGYDNLGLSRSNIVGSVHNHPYDVYGHAYEVNRYPSAADWGRAHADVLAGADASTYSLYVIDTAGAMREFQYTDRAYYEGLSYEQKEAGVGLPASN